MMDPINMQSPAEAVGPRRGADGLLIWLAAIVAAAFAASTIYSLSFYLRIPVDLVGFEESDYLVDLIKLRNGSFLYSDPTDNNSSVYTPGAQLLTYGLARLLGMVSVSGMRVIQFSHLLAAALVAAWATHLLARRFLAEDEYRQRAAWLALWTPLLFLVMTEDRFNFNMHTLHGDSLTLLLTATAGLLIAGYLHRPTPGLLAAMAVLPAIGFWSKQSMLIWAPIFGLLVLLLPRWSLKRALWYGVAAAAAAAVSLLALRAFGGPHALYMVFEVLRGKEVSLARSAVSLLSAGAFLALTLASFAVLARPRPSRELLIGWAIAFGLILLQAYTSGIGWLKNHLGPGILLGMMWFCAALPRVWTDLARRGQEPTLLWRGAFLAAVLGLWGGLDLVRPPVNRVPPDLFRYIAEIEREFDGMDPARTLLDHGSWVYWQSGTVIRDRASAVQLHTGFNQPINREMLARTIERIAARSYDRILMHYPAEGGTYDFRRRGSGVGDALHANYREVRRIRGVCVDRWWPRGLLADVAVFEPRPVVAGVGGAATE